jgi:hypothetical protein
MRIVRPDCSTPLPRSTVESKIRPLKINKNHLKNFAATLSRQSCLESVS